MEHIAEIVGERIWDKSDDGVESDHQFGARWVVKIRLRIGGCVGWTWMHSLYGHRMGVD